MQRLILNKDLEFHYNPFGGIADREVNEAMIEQEFLSDLIASISAESPKIIQLVGKKGRGKTMHLKWLQQRFPDFSLHLLSEKNKQLDISKVRGKGCFVDSIHQLSLRKRLTLFNSAKKIILTTHVHRRLEYALAGASYQSYKIGTISSALLNKLLTKRIKIAATSKTSKIELDTHIIDGLIKKYRDDYRGILNHLFHQFKITSNG